jgi:hypothetical protein
MPKMHGGEGESEKKMKLGEYNYDEWKVQTETNTAGLSLVHIWIRNRAKPIYTTPPFELPVLDYLGAPRTYADDHADPRVRGQPMMTVDPRFTPTGGQLGVVFLLQRSIVQKCMGRQYWWYEKLMISKTLQLEREANIFIKEVMFTCTNHTRMIMESADNFGAELRNGNVLVAWDGARKAAFIADAHILYLDFRRLRTLKMTDATWRMFFKDYLFTMEKLWKRSVSAERLLEAFFAAHFVMACRGSIRLSVAVDAVIDMEKWPAVRTLVETWTGDMQTHQRQLKALSSRPTDAREGSMSSLRKKGASGPAPIVLLYSAYADFMRLQEAKMTDKTWRSYFEQYLSGVERVENTGMSAEQLLQGLFAIHFALACRNSTYLTESVEALLYRKEWECPHVHVLITTWTRVLNVREIMSGLGPKNAPLGGSRSAK